jgi:hypothetical protein
MGAPHSDDAPNWLTTRPSTSASSQLWATTLRRQRHRQGEVWWSEPTAWWPLRSGVAEPTGDLPLSPGEPSMKLGIRRTWYGPLQGSHDCRHLIDQAVYR